MNKPVVIIRSFQPDESAQIRALAALLQMSAHDVEIPKEKPGVKTPGCKGRNNAGT